MIEGDQAKLRPVDAAIITRTVTPLWNLLDTTQT
jgi:hypothetical protein